MDFVLVILLIIVLISILLNAISDQKTQKKNTLSSKANNTPNNIPDWLQERWVIARNELDEGTLRTVPEWFFDNATKRQLSYIEHLGFEIKGWTPTKGEASDIIGLFHPATSADKAILRFFKISTRGMKETKARHAVAQLMLDPSNVNAWETRHASDIQKEFFKFFSLKLPQGLTEAEITKIMHDYKSKLPTENSEKWEEWSIFETTYQEINDPKFIEEYELEEYGLSKIPMSLYKNALKEFKKEGIPLHELDNDSIMKKIIELKEI